MKTTIDSAGRIVIPKKLRDEAGFQAGMELDVRYCHGLIEVEATEVPYRIEDRDGWLVIVAPEGTPKVTNEELEAAITSLRERRGIDGFDD
ncbi:MAG: AbrB/MazE/SpoVT family DNA-binding domain-containing protein [Chloroflexi bacterium]|nr:AbrB/MazE/SpoVT family DNA-binding domain-containing protein [Chloroflexota bacterium]